MSRIAENRDMSPARKEPDTGDSYTGKSQLHKPLLVNLFGKLVDAVQKPTEAAIRQLVGSSSKILLIDELETDKRQPQIREKVFKMLRSATGDGGDIIRGTIGKEIIRFRLQHITSNPTINKTLNMYGLRITQYNDERVILFEIGTMNRNLLNKTEWHNKGIEGLLARIKGAVKMRTKFNSERAWYYCIPLENFIGDDNEDEREEF